MIIIETYLIHYGVGHDKGGHSGRYPWGSGENPEVKLARKQAKQAKKEAKEKAKAEKLNAKFDKASTKIRRGKKVDKNVDTLKETMSKMTDEELRAKIDRLRLEGTYTQLLREANPQKVSAGHKFINNMKDNLARDVPNVLSTKLKDAIGTKLDQVIKDQFNTDVPISSLLKKDLSKLNASELKQVTDHWNALKNAKDAKNQLNPVDELLKKDPSKLTPDEARKVSEYYKNLNTGDVARRSVEQRRREDAQAEEARRAEEHRQAVERQREREQRTARAVNRREAMDAQRQREENIRGWNPEFRNNGQREQAEEAASTSRRIKQQQRETWTGDVEGEGSSHYRRERGPIVDADYQDVDTGRQFLELYLTDSRGNERLLPDRRRH